MSTRDLRRFDTWLEGFFNELPLLLVAEPPPTTRPGDHLDALDSHGHCHRDSRRDGPYDSATHNHRKAVLGGGILRWQERSQMF